MKLRDWNVNIVQPLLKQIGLNCVEPGQNLIWTIESILKNLFFFQNKRIMNTQINLIDYWLI